MKKSYLVALYLINLAIISLFWIQNSGSLIGANAASTMLALGRLFGLLGAFSVITQYTLISQAPWIEKPIGRGKLRKLHTRNGKIALSLIVLHIVLIVSAYSGTRGLVATYWFLFKNLPFVWLASVAFWILVATVGAAMLRQRLPYRVWHTIHTLNYLILALVIWHQLANGGDLAANPTFRIYWTLINTIAIGNLVYFRLIKPRLPKPSAKS